MHSSGNGGVLLCTPTYNGVNGGYAVALFKSQQLLLKHGIETELAIYQGNCHVDDSRNYLVRFFLEGNFEKMVFIDSDLHWEAKDLLQVLSHDKDLVCGVYPKKQKETEFTVKLIPGEKIEGGLIKVSTASTGFMCISRALIESMAKCSESYLAQGDDRSRTRIPVLFERTTIDGIRWGGDTNFCRKWREMGGSVYVDPKCMFTHFGETKWKGSLELHALTSSDNLWKYGLKQIEEGIEEPNILQAMIEDWGNEWSAQLELLQACILKARESENILECGSGISTLFMAAANPEARIVCLEQNRDWAIKLGKMLAKYKLNNVAIIQRELKDFGEYEWYDVPSNLDSSFDFVLVDGPTRDTRGHRIGFIKEGLRLLKGATVLFDDAEDPQVIEMASEIGDCTILGTQRKFAITKEKV
jgi:predicted O-methyltransferase YrrM